jgi:nitroreductase
MDVREALEKRRSYRSLEPVEVTKDMMDELARAAQLMPSCFNNQPWRFVFVAGKEQLLKMREAMNKGNEWTREDSLIIAAFCRKEKDCIIKDREYYLFDTGMAVAAIMLRATEMGLVAHPIAGYSPEKAKDVLGIPEGYTLITLINVGKKSDKTNPVMSGWQVKQEKERPVRRSLPQIYSVDFYNSGLEAENPEQEQAGNKLDPKEKHD